MPWQWHIYDYWISPPRAAKSNPDRVDRQHFQQGTWVGIVEGRAVTFLFCSCGHVATVDRIDGLRSGILPRARCSACGKRGADDMRHGYRCGEIIRREASKKARLDEH